MNKLLCIFGIHSWTDWKEYQKVNIVDGKNDQYLIGYKFYYSRQCNCCKLTEHKMVRV